MEISKNIEIIDLALYLKKHKALIIADLHIGYEEELRKKGILVPRFQFKDTFNMLSKILNKTKPKLIIVNGDLKHEFGTISEQEWRETLKILDLLTEHGKVILIRGNHDNILGPIARKRNVEIKEHYKINDVLILHGNKIPDNKLLKDIKTIVIGHEHPAVSLRDKTRAEKFKCFLKGKWKRKTLIVMPSFITATEGTDILNEGQDILKKKLISPFLTNINNFEIFIVEDKVYRFGKVRSIK